MKYIIFKKYKEEEFLKENLNRIKIENEVEYGKFYRNKKTITFSKLASVF